MMTMSADNDEVEAVARAIAHDDPPNEWHRIRARNAIAALDAVRGDGWLPIASAPDDGNDIIVFGGKFAREDMMVRVRSADGEWWRCGSAPSSVPTHWRPLPPPPAREVGGE